MKKRLIGIIALMLLTTLALSSCSVVDTVVDFVKVKLAPTVKIDAEPLAAEKIIDFENGANHDLFTESDGWSNGDVFNVVWKEKNVKYENQVMKLGITEEKASAYFEDKEATVEYDYTAGESRSQLYYGYGDYEVSMKPSANPGTASTFFICTGPYDVKNGVKNPHDEIDIEFLGEDTTKVQFNFFVNGKGNNEFMYDLGFDATEGFHEYGFRWTETSITWFVDNEPVYMVTTDASAPKWAKNVKIVEAIPSTAGRILANYWCGNQDAWGWMGVYNGEVNDQGTEYKWFATSAQGAPLNPPVEPDTEGAEIDWSKVEAIAPTFQSTEIYTVVNDGTKSNVTYSAVGGASYLNVEMDVTDAAAVKNYVHLKVTNNGSTTSKVRVNINNAANTAINLSATQDGVEVYTDLTYGGSFFEIPAGATAELVVRFSGVASKLQLMLDSATYGDTNTYAGDLTFDEIKFAAVGEIDTPEDPVTPTPDSGLQFNFWASNSAVYTTNGNNIKFNGVADSTYACVGADISTLAKGNNTFTVTITNNGTADSRVRFDIQATTKVGNHTVVNTAATGGDVDTNFEWGGSAVTVAAGKSVTLVITYDENTERGAVKDLVIFVDTCRGDGNSYNSDVTLSGMAFSKVELPHVNTLKVGDTNKIVVDGDTFNAYNLPIEWVVFTADEAATYSFVGNNSALVFIYAIDADFTDPALLPLCMGTGTANLAAGQYLVCIGNGLVGEINVAVTKTLPEHEHSYTDRWCTCGDWQWHETDKYYAFKGDPCYTLSATETEYVNFIKVSYTGVNDKSYSNVNTWIQDKAAGNNTLNLSIRNNGTETVVITVKLEKEDKTKVAEYKMTIPAGEAQTLSETFTGAPDLLYFFVDSGWIPDDQAVQSHSGNVTIAGVYFTSASEESAPVYADLWSFWANGYTTTVAEDGKSITFVYNDLPGSWDYCAGCDLAQLAENNRVTFVVKNNIPDTVVKILAKVEAGSTPIKEVNIDASGDELVVTIDYDPALLGESNRVLLHIDAWQGGEGTYSGNITLSNFQFTTVE